MAIELRAQVGPLPFRLHSVGVLNAPAPGGAPFAEYDGAELLRVVEGERAFLVIDHRAAGAGSGVAYAELWLPTSPVEGGLDGLLVLAPPPPSARPLANALSLSALAQALRRLPAPGYTSR